MSLGQCNPQSKILWHLDRVQEWSKYGTTLPIIFEIDPSNKCNQDCPWCSFSKLRSESQSLMCWDTLKKLLKSMKNMDVRAINWTGGGEPLVNPITLDGIILARLMGFDQGMFTNGVLLNEKAAEIMAPRMTWVRFSIDGYDQDSYAKSHGTSDRSFDVVIKNLKHLCSIPNRCTVGVGFIMTEENYNGAGKLVQIAKESGADYIQFKPVVQRKPHKQLSKEVLKDMLGLADLLQNIHETDIFKVMVTRYRFYDIMSHESNYGRVYTKCLSHHFQGAIGADQKVYLCDHHKGEPEYELGDLNKDSLETIWQSNKRKQVIYALDNTDLSQCMDCCRNHELNKFLWHVKHVKQELHPNHI